MARPLKDILKGVKSSTTVAGSTGDKPAVDYKPKTGDEQQFINAHSTEKHDDRVGNGDNVYSGKPVEYSLSKTVNRLLGKKLEQAVSDEFKPSKTVKEGAMCNHTVKGKSCPIHGNKPCPAESTPDMNDDSNQGSNN